MTSDPVGPAPGGLQPGLSGSTPSPADPAEKPTLQLAHLRRADAGDRDALEAFARWTYGVMSGVLRSRGRRWPVDDIEDAVQLAVCHVVERLGHCRAENDYQLHAWVALIGWRAVLRDRLERRSLDARHPGREGRRDAIAVALPAPEEDDDGAPQASPAGAPLPDALRDVLGGFFQPLEGAGDRTRHTPPSHTRRVAAAVYSAPTGEPRGVAAPPALGRSIAGADPAQAAAREHAVLARAFLCRLTVETYEGLPPATQHMFWLRLVEGASWAVVGAAAGTTGAAAKRRVQRAEATLARRVGARVRGLPPAYAALILAYCRRLDVVVPETTARRAPPNARGGPGGAGTDVARRGDEPGGARVRTTRQW